MIVKVLNCAQWYEMVQNGAELGRKALNCAESRVTVPNATQWSWMVQMSVNDAKGINFKKSYEKKIYVSCHYARSFGFTNFVN